MKISDSRAFVNHVLIGSLVTIGFGGSLGLGTVWLRHQVSVLADDNRALVQQINETERHIADTKALVEEAQSSDVLRSENESMRLGLVEMTQQQIVAVNEDPMARLVARANQRLYESESGSAAVAVHLNLEPTPSAPAPAVAPSTRVPLRLADAPSVDPTRLGAVAAPVIKLQFALSQ